MGAITKLDRPKAWSPNELAVKACQYFRRHINTGKRVPIKTAAMMANCLLRDGAVKTAFAAAQLALACETVAEMWCQMAEMDKAERAEYMAEMRRGDIPSMWWIAEEDGGLVDYEGEDSPPPPPRGFTKCPLRWRIRYLHEEDAEYEYESSAGLAMVLAVMGAMCKRGVCDRCVYSTIELKEQELDEVGALDLATHSKCGECREEAALCAEHANGCRECE